jgi:beta/gamma crystallin
MNNSTRFVVGAGLLSLLPAAAMAAEITIYKQPQFRGAQLTLRGHTPEIRSVGFADQASSIVVTSGRWELCTQPEFKGECVTLGPGEYPTLDARLNHRVESARDVGAYANQTGNYSRYGRGTIELHGQPGFSGRSMELDRDAPTLEGTGFNDRASSVVVKEGTWQLCSEPNFAGTCRTYAPGRYADLGYGMAKQVSSARVVRGPRQAPAVLSGGVEAPETVGDEGKARVILFSQGDFRGDSMAVSGVNGSLERDGFDDAAASMVIEGGRWTFCSEAFFRGECKTIGPGRYRNLREVGLHRAISSVRPAGAPVAVAPPAGPRPDPNADISLFPAANFQGRAMVSKRDISNLGPTDYNDRTGSVVVSAGQWELCTDGEYKGRCVVVGPGSYASLGGLDKQISSVRRIR